MLHDIRTARALAYAIFFVGFASVAGADPVVETVSAEGLSRLLDEGVKVIDVRRADEWRATGVIPGSRIITAFDAQGYLNPHFIEEVSVLVGRSQSVALICRSGNRSAAAAQLLVEQLDYAHVYNVAGGIQEWLREGRPVSACKSC